MFLHMWRVFFIFYDKDQIQIVQEEAKTNVPYFLQCCMVFGLVKDKILSEMKKHNMFTKLMSLITGNYSQN